MPAKLDFKFRFNPEKYERNRKYQPYILKKWCPVRKMYHQHMKSKGCNCQGFPVL